MHSTHGVPLSPLSACPFCTVFSLRKCTRSPNQSGRGTYCNSFSVHCGLRRESRRPTLWGLNRTWYVLLAGPCSRDSCCFCFFLTMESQGPPPVVDQQLMAVYRKPPTVKCQPPTTIGSGPRVFCNTIAIVVWRGQTFGHFSGSCTPHIHDQGVQGLLTHVFNTVHWGTPIKPPTAIALCHTRDPLKSCRSSTEDDAPRNKTPHSQTTGGPSALGYLRVTYKSEALQEAANCIATACGNPSLSFIPKKQRGRSKRRTHSSRAARCTAILWWA